MSRRDLLAHVVTKFAPRQWENVASESLLYLLKQDTDSVAINTLLAPTHVTLTNVRWHSQATDTADNAIPDLVADDLQRRHVLIIESKFWAGLTDNQPNGYLRRQNSQFAGSADPRLLLFVAPSQRVELLAQRLGQVLDADPEAAGALRLIRSAGGDVAVTSWGDVLAALQHRFEASGDAAALDDLAQLRGLCDRADQFAHLPLASDDIDPIHASRQLRYHDMLDTVVSRLVGQGVLNTDSLQSRGTKTWWGRNVREPHTRRTFLLTVSLGRWSESYPTPFWLSVWMPSRGLVQALESALDSDTPWHEVTAERIVIAIRTPLGREHDDVIDSLAATCARLSAAIQAGAESEPAAVEEPLGDSEA